MHPVTRLREAIRWRFARACDVSPQPRYWNFGYMPSGNLKRDWREKLVGCRNYIKRLQADDLMSALALKPAETVLDLGCGHGYVTVEMAKVAAKAWGIDVNPALGKTRIPDRLRGRLEFRVVSGVEIPFPDAHFDCVLASEVLPMIPEPMLFMTEIRRVLKPGGRVVVLNGAGHPGIADAYRRGSRKLERLRRRYGKRVPTTYEAYCEILQASFGTAQRRFFQREDLAGFISGAGFTLESIRGTPAKSGGDHFSWSQFRSYLATSVTLRQTSFLLRFWWFSFLALFDRRPFEGGLLCVARKPRA